MHSHEKALMKAVGSKSYAPRMGSKGQALEYFKAKKNHKKRPHYEPKERKPSAFKKLSIDEYEKKYGIV